MRYQCVFTVLNPQGGRTNRAIRLFGCPLLPRPLTTSTRAHPELGKEMPDPSPLGPPKQKARSDELVLQDKVSSSHGTLIASAHPLAPSQSPLYSLSHGTLHLLLPFLVLAMPIPSPPSPPSPALPARDPRTAERSRTRSDPCSVLTLGSQETSAWVLLPAGAALRASADVSPACTRQEFSCQ